MPPDPLPPYEQELRAFLAPLGVDLDAQAVVFQLYRTSTDVIAALEAKALRPLGLSHTGFALLVTIWVGGPQEVRSLARKHRLSKPSIVSAIGTLERMGLVAQALDRGPAAGERRAHGSGTPAGAQGPGCPPPLRARAHRRAHEGRAPADGGLAPARGRRGEERRMRLATFTHGGTTRAGVVVDDEVVDLGPSEMTALLASPLERVAE